MSERPEQKFPLNINKVKFALGNFKWICLIVLTLICTGNLLAVRMSPAAFTAQNIPIGTEFDLSVPLTIRLSENDTIAKKFTVTPLLPSEVRSEWLAGYEEIPSADFLKIGGEGDIFVSPREPAIRRLLIEFPDDNSLLNRHFLVHLRVMPQDVSGMFQAVLVGSYLLETSPSADRFTKPGGHPISVSPSIVAFDSLGFATVRIYNNHDSALEVILRLDIPPQTDKMQVELTRGFIRGVLGDGVSIDKSKILVQAGGFEDVTIRIKPDFRATISRNSEYILWLEVPGFEKSERFIRVHYRP